MVSHDSLIDACLRRPVCEPLEGRDPAPFFVFLSALTLATLPGPETAIILVPRNEPSEQMKV